jgi:hypothetical protein
MKDALSQAPSVTVNKILNTINNLVRVLELVLTLPIIASPSSPTIATVTLPKVTTLRSGLDPVLPQFASTPHSKVLTNRDCIAAITPSPPAIAAVTLPKVTTLRSGLDPVLPEFASTLYSKVLTNCIAAITKWAASVHHPSATSTPRKASSTCSSSFQQSVLYMLLPQQTT